ncbi:uncharacterized protein LOC115929071 [Strongylocentrotus purpuratus]|uniref:B box-type domain-containing protein n=1 Tax=Strongylocentrotus purpuratus TaxID=7668 RepID=A0A7M7PLN4_STRPU|nr:uncharacterized protein LOC115929071 [Strongylocentrotus purpuratus]
MASLFDALGFKCEECGNDGDDETQGYKVVEQRHLCPTCARNLASAILADMSHGAIKWPCPQHESKEVELLCCKCKVAVCHTCALTTHHGHQMQDIEKFFAEKREIVKKDVEEISAKQNETQSFLDKIESCSREMDGHFIDIKEKVSVTFQTKSQDQKERNTVQVAKVNAEAEELIRQINEKRRMELAEINEQYDNEHETLVKDRYRVLAELKVIVDIVCRMTAEAKASAETTGEELESTAAVAKSIMVDCDGKTFHKKVAKYHEMGMDKLPCLDHDHLDKLSTVAKKIRFKRVDDEQKIGILTGKNASFEMVKTVNISSDIQEPFLLGAIDEQTVVFRNGNGSALYSVNVKSGSMETLLTDKKTRGIWDLAVLPDKGFVYSDYNAGLLQFCDRDGNDERSLALPNDESRFAYLTVDRKGKLLAASHNSGEIHVSDPETGSHLRTINDIECKPMMGIGTLANGDIIIRSGNSDICRIFRATGEVKMKFPLADWSRRLNFHVGADDMIYVTYRTGLNQDYIGFVSLLSPNGDMRREKVIEFPTSYLYRYHPRCVVPVPGTVIILNGNALLVYKEIPGVYDLLN